MDMADDTYDISGADISEDWLARLGGDMLTMLLRDHTTGGNILWLTHDYEPLGKGYEYGSPITVGLITGTNGGVIVPRVRKTASLQTGRKRDKAEVFTPSWVCNAQNNLIDEAWFGRKDVFNHDNGDHSWTVTEGKIAFSDVKGKTWKDYVRANRMEITCGEAPYIVSRYDTVTGAPIAVGSRIGILDRKLRVVGENTDSTGDWLRWAQEAYMSTYGYEWQGDSLLIARESLFVSFIDYYRHKFDALPLAKSLAYIAYIISWNLWQMDGLKGVVPDTCGVKPTGEQDLFGPPVMKACEGCRTGDIHSHNGTYCIIRDWRAKGPKGEGPGRKIRFVDMMKKTSQT